METKRKYLMDTISTRCYLFAIVFIIFNFYIHAEAQGKLGRNKGNELEKTHFLWSKEAEEDHENSKRSKRADECFSCYYGTNGEVGWQICDGASVCVSYRYWTDTTAYHYECATGFWCSPLSVIDGPCFDNRATAAIACCCSSSLCNNATTPPAFPTPPPPPIIKNDPQTVANVNLTAGEPYIQPIKITEDTVQVSLGIVVTSGELNVSLTASPFDSGSVFYPVKAPNTDNVVVNIGNLSSTNDLLYIHIKGVLNGVDNVGKIGAALGSRVVYEEEESDHTLWFIIGGGVLLLVVIVGIATVLHCRYRSKIRNAYPKGDKHENVKNAEIRAKRSESLPTNGAVAADNYGGYSERTTAEVGFRPNMSSQATLQDDSRVASLLIERL